MFPDLPHAMYGDALPAIMFLYPLHSLGTGCPAMSTVFPFVPIFAAYHAGTLVFGFCVKYFLYSLEFFIHDCTFFQLYFAKILSRILSIIKVYFRHTVCLLDFILCSCMLQVSLIRYVSSFPYPQYVHSIFLGLL